MTATIYLLRHAAHDNVGGFLAGRTPGIRLGVDGLAQAERLGKRMAREQFGAIYASPRERTQETAAAVAASHGLAVQTAEELDEIDFGAWNGSTFDQLNTLAEWQRWNAQRSMAETPNGETMLDVQRRVLALIRRLIAAEPQRRLVLVTHADVIKTAVFHVLGLPIDAWPRLEVSPASITTVVLGDWGSKLLCLNEVID